MQTQSATPTSGWFNDPDGAPLLRYFDGFGWTNVTRPSDSNFPGFAQPAPMGIEQQRSTAFLMPPPAIPRIGSTFWYTIRRLLLPKGSGVRLLARLMGTALLLVSFTTLGYSLWETRISSWMTERTQNELRNKFEAAVQTAPPTTVLLTPQQPLAIAPAPPPITPLPAHGTLAGHLTIPVIGVDEMILVGTDTDTLKDAPGLWESGVYPGMPGNATLSGHRTTYGGPFRHLDALKNGDQIIFDSPAGARTVFEVRGTGIVSPDSVQVTEQGSGVRITLTTCDPPGTARKRLVIQAELVEGTFVSQATPAAEWVFRGE